MAVAETIESRLAVAEEDVSRTWLRCMQFVGNREERHAAQAAYLDAASIRSELRALAGIDD